MGQGLPIEKNKCRFDSAVGHEKVAGALRQGLSVLGHHCLLSEIGFERTTVGGRLPLRSMTTWNHGDVARTRRYLCYPFARRITAAGINRKDVFSLPVVVPQRW